MSDSYLHFSLLQTKVLKSIRIVNGTRVEFEIEDGSVYALESTLERYEPVAIYEIAGSIPDLLGEPLQQAETSCTQELRTRWVHGWESCEEWTFYRLRTAKGSVRFSWYAGTGSNYGTEIAFFKVRGSDREEAFSAQAVLEMPVPGKPYIH
jgi:hypothetical protein